MNAAALPPPRTPTRSAIGDDHDVWRAWACLGASPVAFGLALVVGQGASGLLGDDGTGVAPWWVVTASVVVALVVFSAPAALATWFWRRARGRGDDSGRLPAVILITISAGFLAVTLLTYLSGPLVAGT